MIFNNRDWFYYWFIFIYFFNNFCLIFDEIDNGISGNIAVRYGEEFVNISKNNQIIVITHLPQIAAKAEHHFKVIKIKESSKYYSTIKKLNQENNYIADPHSAIGYLGLKKDIQENNLNNCNGLFVSTAHPIKFKDTVENSIKSQLEYPDSIKSIMDREKSAKTMKSYSELKEYLMHKDWWKRQFY